MLNSELGILLCHICLLVQKLGILFIVFLEYIFYMMFPFKLCF